MKNIPLINNLFIFFLNLLVSLIEFKEHPLKEHRCKFKTDKIAYSNRSLEQRIPIIKVSLHCILKRLSNKITFLFCT